MAVFLLKKNFSQHEGAILCFIDLRAWEDFPRKSIARSWDAKSLRTPLRMHDDSRTSRPSAPYIGACPDNYSGLKAEEERATNDQPGSDARRSRQDRGVISR